MDVKPQQPYEYPLIVAIGLISLVFTVTLIILSQRDKIKVEHNSIFKFLMINVLIASTLDSTIQTINYRPDPDSNKETIQCKIQSHFKLFSIVSEEFWVISVARYCYSELKETGETIISNNGIIKKLIYLGINYLIPLGLVEIVGALSLLGPRTFFCWLVKLEDVYYLDYYSYFVLLAILIFVIITVLTYSLLKKRNTDSKLIKSIICRLMLFPLIQFCRMLFYEMRFFMDDRGSPLHFVSIFLRSTTALMYGICFAFNVDIINDLICKKKKQDIQIEDDTFIINNSELSED